MNSAELLHKEDSALRTIGEVAESLNLPPHVLRFWESKFSQIKPTKRRGQHRYYRPEDIAILKHIRHLLYEQGFTIKGAQKHLRGVSKKVKSKENIAKASLQGDLFESLINEPVIAKKSTEILPVPRGKEISISGFLSLLPPESSLVSSLKSSVKSVSSSGNLNRDALKNLLRELSNMKEQLRYC